jgi:hypothetical protein
MRLNRILETNDIDMQEAELPEEPHAGKRKERHYGKVHSEQHCCSRGHPDSPATPCRLPA